MRAAWLAQRDSDYFFEDIGEVALQPGHGGILEIRLNGEMIFSRKESGRFPEAKEIKQLIRDQIEPKRDSDTAIASNNRNSAAMVPQLPPIRFL